MNYYIQGSPDRAEEIKAAFKKLGYNTGNLEFTSSLLYYTIEGKVELMCPKSLQNLIKTHPDYKELELHVEPKFKVGDWVVKKDGTTFYGGNYAEQITIIESEEWDKRIWFSSTTWLRENDIRLWTIADAKDGDVLYSLDSKQPFIYKVRPQFSQAIGYCCINKFGDFAVWNTNKCIICTDKYIPATKEQCDLLFTKMKEAGYQWDAEKKELRKIKHYDIAKFKPFDKVLVRCGNDEEWMIEFYCKYDTLVHTSPHMDYPFMGIGDSYSQCIPFNEETKHLLGTNDMCDEQYINW